MDFFAHAAFLAAIVFALVEGTKRVFPDLSPRATAAVGLVIGQAAVFLVAYSDWAKDTEVGGKTLDNVNIAALIAVGLLAWGLAVAGFEGLKAIKNIGANQDG